MGLKDWIKDAPAATFGLYALRPDGTIEKLAGPDKGRYSLADAVVELGEGSELRKRVTATRVLATGVFALALKKKSGGERWLLISGPDFEWLEEVPRKKQTEAVKFVQKVQAAQRELGRRA